MIRIKDVSIELKEHWREHQMRWGIGEGSLEVMSEEDFEQSQ